MQPKYCPYNTHIEQIYQETIEYCEDGKESFKTTKLIEEISPTQCKGKACGAWAWGACKRR